ncbi:GNAT family N-acetyltransferase [Pelomonas sp. CA6]|uniref:GNAT family N-acetyltransferase n=1 Tax=Pelomonas sp. CA6 TaxID=2907999 RepID=UPI001F4C5077|nr:GNAT family N-acetyltransferase [Pelomonas sp. CA6]MCH7345355.1 GNAT family N-acetyltransferase [Pelomonas sp. CA6]
MLSASVGLGWTLRPARPEHAPAMQEVERVAAYMFPSELLPPALSGQVTPLETLQAGIAAGCAWVCLDWEGRVLGFALCREEAGCLHLAEMDVLPAVARRGIGRRLLALVQHEARQRGLRACTLTTFRSLPWNAPFYAGAGFRALEPRGDGVQGFPHLAELLAQEAAQGLNDRVAMVFSL